MPKVKISVLKSKYNVPQKDIAKLLNISRTEVILRESEDQEIEVSDSYLCERKKIIESNRISVVRDNIAPIASKSQLDMIKFVNDYLADYPKACKVNKENVFARSRLIIGMRVKEARERLGITLDTLADNLSRPVFSCYNLECGRNRLNHDITSQIAYFLHVPDIVFDEELVQLEQSLLNYELRQAKL